jgi:DNA-directed RNA polymerase subunit N (RpoN/RPB10)
MFTLKERKCIMCGKVIGKSFHSFHTKEVEQHVDDLCDDCINKLSDSKSVFRKGFIYIMSKSCISHKDADKKEGRIIGYITENKDGRKVFRYTTPRKQNATFYKGLTNIANEISKRRGVLRNPIETYLSNLIMDETEEEIKPLCESVIVLNSLDYTNEELDALCYIWYMDLIFEREMGVKIPQMCYMLDFAQTMTSYKGSHDRCSCSSWVTITKQKLGGMLIQSIAMAKIYGVDESIFKFKIKDGKLIITDRNNAIVSTSVKTNAEEFDYKENYVCAAQPDYGFDNEIEDQVELDTSFLRSGREQAKVGIEMPLSFYTTDRVSNNKVITSNDTIGTGTTIEPISYGYSYSGSYSSS